MTSQQKEYIGHKIQVAIGRIKRVVAELSPVAAFGLFSGGHDSFSASMVFSVTPGLHHRFLHIDTGTGVPLTRQYVEETAARRGWELIVKEAKKYVNAKGKPDPQDYEALVMAHGFPGPGHHGKMYNRLKERGLRIVEREYGANCRGKNKRRVLFVSGCRSQESERRMANTDEVQIDGRRIWCAPIHDWSKLDTSLLMEYAVQPRNPIVDLIHKSGECLCGAFAEPGELEELGMWPQTRSAYDRLKALEAKVKPIHGWGWEGKPPREKKCKLQPGQLCWSCTK